MNITVNIEDSEFDIDKEVKNTLQTAAQNALPYAKDNAPVDSGTLRDSIEVDDTSVFSTVDYAPLVHDGTAYQRGVPFIKRAVNRTDLINQ